MTPDELTRDLHDLRRKVEALETRLDTLLHPRAETFTLPAKPHDPKTCERCRELRGG